MQIIENLLDQRLADEIEKHFFSWDFPWYYYPATSVRYADNDPIAFTTTKNTIETPQLNHIFKYDYKERCHLYKEMIIPMMDCLERRIHLDIKDKVYRAKANLLLPNNGLKETDHHSPHADMTTSEGSYFSMIYYVNESDGDTLFFDKTIDGKTSIDPESISIIHRETPKKNKLIIFDSDQLHCSSNPRFGTGRSVINFVVKR